MSPNLTIDIWGKCGEDLSCPKGIKTRYNDCENKIESDYFFYFAFENSICDYYSTEKLWTRSKNYYTVPVVLNRSIAESVGFPGDGFIAVDDFSNVTELGDYLFKLQHDHRKYEK